MGSKENGFKKRLLSTFIIEANDHIKAFSAGLIELEKGPAQAVQMEILETIFRDIHSLKGAARAVNIASVESICQSVEGVISALKQRKIELSQALFDKLHHASDTINVLISSIEGRQPAPGQAGISKLINSLSTIESGDAVSTDMHEERLQPQVHPVYDTGSTITREAFYKKRLSISDTVRISTTKLGSLLLQTEEMLTAKQAVNQFSLELREIRSMFEALKSEWQKASFDLPLIEMSSRKYRQGTDTQDISRYTKTDDFLSWSQTHIRSIDKRLAAIKNTNNQFSRSFERMVDGLLEDMKRAMMLPFSMLLESFPVFVRNISNDLGKEAELVIRGDSIEIDRRILEEIKDPLIHLVRNSLDHGIERPDIRAMNNKQRRGIITVAISQLDGNKVEILVSDDGAGINPAKVREVAVTNGIISSADAENLSDQQAIPLIFHSGFSTSPIITDISGRGIGLAIVREKVERLGGVISVKTGVKTGTTFRIMLPLTVATFRGVLVKAHGRSLIIPTINVVRTMRVRSDDLRTVENRETITIGGRPCSFIRLGDLLGLPLRNQKENGKGYITVLVLSVAENSIAFGVDEVLGEQEFLVKNLGRQLSRVRNVAGSALLATGKPVPVLNVSDLMRSAVRTSAAPSTPSVFSEGIDERRKSLLVVEDSITSRTLLKSILESAGYEVRTAVDGIDAITMLKTGEFDLVVSDIEMPRMNGFDLTARIRADKKLADIPVVLVTALDTREDRERGIDAGANAYIVKSSFEQSNLLEVVKRLI